MRRLIAGFCLVFLAAPALAKPPVANTLFPAGGQRGQTLTVKVAGTFEPWPVLVDVQGDGVQAVAGDKPGELRVAIAQSAPAGVAWLRLYNAEGASTARAFVVGTLPEIEEVEPNDDPMKAQAVTGPAVTVNGVLARRGDVDGYAVTLEKGQTLVASVAASRPLGSPMDGVLQVATPSGVVLAQVDDSPERDPRLIFHAKESGTYVVRVFAFPAEPNQTIAFAGGADYIYRLTMTTQGMIDYPWPLVVTREAAGAVELLGWNLPDGASASYETPADPATGVTLAQVPGTLAGTATLHVVDHPALVEMPREAEETPQELPVPGSLSGRIAKAAERDVYRFAAKKGETLTLRVESRGLGFPLDAKLVVRDGAGKVLAEQDDEARRGLALDPTLRFSAPADGEYQVSVADLNGMGGERFAYRLDIVRGGLPVALRTDAGNYTLVPGKPTTITVTVEGGDGSDGGPTEVSVEGLPPGVTAKPATVGAGGGGGERGRGRRGNAGRTVELQLVADASVVDPAGWSGRIQVVSRSKGEPSRVAQARAKDTMSGGNIPVVLSADGPDGVWLTVSPREAEAPKPDSSK